MYLSPDVVEDGNGAMGFPAGVHQVEVSPVHHHPLVGLGINIHALSLITATVK